MENKHASNGIAEDLIRAFVQIASAELHTKTSIEKAVSEIENGADENFGVLMDKVAALQADLLSYAELRREIMLNLYSMYGEKGNKEMWCTVKHLGMAMYTAFEAYQASDNDPELFDFAMRANRMFIRAITEFLGVEVTECAACFSDILKAGGSYET
ncbi:hypothetical protein [Faecalibaculum rodentium]|uniref:hypothetical protein n=1 Tax=Faecalibaculum rodentium TaxID=1702221 RepID=UPI0023F3BDF4|nr:hypothetical protein [Faecalibaculum rodentium]